MLSGLNYDIIIIVKTSDYSTERGAKMPYVKAADRDQIMMCSLDSFVDTESVARIIDAFVESLDITSIITKEYSFNGRPPYDPKSILKLYIYGNRKGIRTSRKLAESCKVNLEVRWMLGCVEPDFRTISDFRKDNISALKKVFHEFNKRILSAVETGYTSIDGSKFQANNSKENNFTATKLDDRIKWLNNHTDEYLRLLQELDEQEDLEEKDELTRDEIEERLQKAKERLERYEGYRRLMDESGASQISLTDADARLMKNKNDFSVAYNPQTVVDSETHIIRDFQMTNHVSDYGLLNSTLEAIKKQDPNKIIETVADKGYGDIRDMAKCLENGIIPHVITDDGKDSYEIELFYEENEIDKDSTIPKELSKCLHAGVIPTAYEKHIEDIEIKECKKRVFDEPEKAMISPYGTEEEMKERAAEGYFVRDPERNIVYCPAGEILRFSSIKRNGRIRYTNSAACRRCKYRNQCFKGKSEWKSVDFSKDGFELRCKLWKKETLVTEDHPKVCERNIVTRKYHFEKRKVVSFKLKPDRSKMMNRMCLSEHPFGTIKRAMGATHFLLKGLEKVEGEFALFCLGYNIERARNLLGFNKIMELMQTL